MRTSHVFVCIVLLSAPGYCQNLADLYRHELPSQYVNDPTTCQMINATLEAKAGLHPELVYFALRQFSLNSEKDFQGARTTAEQISVLEDRFQRERNAWAQSQIDLLLHSSLDPNLERDAARYFQSIMSPVREEMLLKETTQSFDPNKLNYIVSKYYAKDPGSSYSPGISYGSIRLEAENAIAVHLDSLWDENDEFLDEEVIDEVLRCWYLFVPSIQSMAVKPFTWQPARLVCRMLQRPRESSRSAVISIAAGYDIISVAPDVKDNLPIPKMGISVDATETLRDLTPSIALAFGYRIRFSEYFGALTSLRLQALFKRANGSRVVPLASLYLDQYTSGESDYTNKVTFLTNTIDVSSVTTVLLKCTTPAFMMWEGRVTLEPGVCVAFHQISYERAYDYTYVKTQGYHYTWSGAYYVKTLAAGRVRLQTEHRTATDISFLPVVDVMTYLPVSLTLETSVGLGYLSMRLGYGLW